MKIFHSDEAVAVWKWHVRQLDGYRERVHPEDRERIWREWDAAVAEPAPYRTIFRTTNSDGRTRWVEASAAWALDEDGSPGLLIGRIEDITEQVCCRQDFEDFVHAASHDLKEPLRAVSSFSQLLSRSTQGSLSSDAEQYLGFILDGAQRMRDLVDGLLALSRAGGPLSL